jgi:hypothetical protein
MLQARHLRPSFIYYLLPLPGSKDPNSGLAVRTVLIDEPHASRRRVLTGTVNKNMDERLHAVHVLRLLKIGHFYHPTRRLRLLQMTQKIV